MPSILQDFTSVWDLLDLLFAEILQFVSQLMNRFSQSIKRDERNEEIIIYVCRFRRSWERLETLQKTEIKTHQLHASPKDLHQHQIWLDWSLVTQSSTFTASASFFSYSLNHIRATWLQLTLYVNFLGNQHISGLIVGLSRFAQEKQLKGYN